MTKLINYTICFKQIDKFFEKFNEGKTMTDATRLKSNTKSIAKALITLYGRDLYKKQMLFIEGTIGSELYDDVPPLSTNNIRIAKSVNCGDRTVKRHILKLVDAGFISKKVNHGRVNNYEVWINPEILGVKKKLDLKEINKVISTQILAPNSQKTATTENEKKPSLRTERPLNSSSELKSKNITNINNTLVDDSDDSNSVSPKVETKEQKQDTRESKSKKNTTKNKTEEKTKKSSAKSEVLTKYINTMVGFLWNYAIKSIYVDFEMMEHQELIGKQHLIKYFHRATNQKEAGNLYEMYVKRVGMASVYYKKYPDYEIHLPSHYFDPNNKKGFTATAFWYKKWIEGKKKTAKNKVLNLALRRIKAAPKDVSVYIQAQQSVYKTKDKDLLDKFNKRVIIT